MKRACGIWTDAGASVRLTEMWAEGLTSAEIARCLVKEFKQPCTKNAVVGRTWRLNLPRRPTCIRPPAPKKSVQSTWSLKRRVLQGERLKRYWQARKAGGEHRPKVPEVQFETVEQYIARGGHIHRIELRSDLSTAGVPAYPTRSRGAMAGAL